MLFRLFLLSFLLTSCNTKQEAQVVVASFQNKSFYQHLAKFDTYSRRYPGPINSSVVMNPSGKKVFHLVVACMIHGDEIGCLPAINEVIRLIESNKLRISGAVTFFIGNREAALQGKRFYQYDLNRLFATSSSRTLENNRAKEIASVLDTADLYIDIHQTIEPTSRSFYTLPFDTKSIAWARALEATDVMVVREPGVPFAAGLMTSSEYAVKRGIPAVTFETSQRGFSEESYQRAMQIMLRAIYIISSTSDVKNEKSISRIAEKTRKVQAYKRVANRAFVDRRMKLQLGFQNFDEVKKGQRLGEDQNGKPMFAEEDGLLLFPKYPKRNEKGEAEPPLPSDIYLLLKKNELK